MSSKKEKQCDKCLNLKDESKFPKGSDVCDMCTSARKLKEKDTSSKSDDDDSTDLIVNPKKTPKTEKPKDPDEKKPEEEEKVKKPVKRVDKAEKALLDAAWAVSAKNLYDMLLSMDDQLNSFVRREPLVIRRKVKTLVSELLSVNAKIIDNLEQVLETSEKAKLKPVEEAPKKVETPKEEKPKSEESSKKEEPSCKKEDKKDSCSRKEADD